MDKYLDILKTYWGYDEFRSPQDKIIKSVGEGNDTLGLMPTGGGKSITFQVPTMAKDGLCLVISPLIALMKDQVDNLKKRGIKAAAIYSGMSQREMEICMDNCIYGAYKFLYVSPERLSTRMFAEKAVHLNICLIAVDESHCISQWGYDFRPQYLKIADIRRFFPEVPVLALTATATPEVAADIQKQLMFKTPNVIKKSFERKNLSYVSRQSDNKSEELLKVLKGVPGTSIVYVRNRKTTAEVADFLRKNGISACNYHAGLDIVTKDRLLEQWKTGRYRVMVATNAFGMGIDKADVRSVIHIDIPESPEAYFQEAGRAGRDGKKAFAVLIFDKNDIRTLRQRVTNSFPPKDFIKDVYGKLCDSYGIGEYDAEGMRFDFDLQKLCTVFRLPITQTYSALKILSLAGYIEYVEDNNRGPAIMMESTRDHLYQIKTSEKDDHILQILMRTYTGIFSEYAYINLHKIAELSGTTAEMVSEQLINLSKQHIIKYIPPKNGSTIYFTQQRQPLKYLRIDKEVYETRRDREKNRIEAIISYATDTSKCKSAMLLQYFGENDYNECGICDFCIGKRKQSSGKLEAEILDTIKKGEISISELSARFNCDSKRVLSILRHHIDCGTISINGDRVSLVV